MALTLDATLASSQELLSRHPIVEIISSQFIDDIPFDGSFLTSETRDEKRPNAIMHSSGRIFLAYIFDSGQGFSDTRPNSIKFAYTDTERRALSFSTYQLESGWGPILDLSLCELANGNIGIIFITTYLSYRKLMYLIVDQEANVIKGATQIAQHTTSDEIIDMPWVARAGNGNYVLVYRWYDLDPITHSLLMRTSSDFQSWSSASAITLSGLDPTYPKYNPSLIRLTNNDLWLWFEYREDVRAGAELTNIYYVVSSDHGATWSAPTKITNYDTFSPVAKHPVAVQKFSDQMHLIFDELRAALHIDKDTPSICASEFHPSSIGYDAVNGKLYALGIYCGSGYKYLQCVIKVDVATWQIEDCWNCSTVPAFPAPYCSGSYHVWYGKDHIDGHLVPVGTASDPYIASVSLLDGEANSIRDFHFKSNPTLGITANVSGINLESSTYLGKTWVDAENQRLWVLFFKTYYYSSKILVGYIDLTESGPIYNWNEVVNDSDVTEVNTYALFFDGELIVLPDWDYIIVSMGHVSNGSYWVGRLKVYHYSTGALIKDFYTSANPGFPYHGLRRVCFYENKIYGGFIYDGAIAGEEDKRGLCIINLADDTITYSRPDFASVDDYKIGAISSMGDGRLIMNCYTYGIAIYDTDGGTWTLFSNDTLPGLTPTGGEEYMDQCAPYYDAESGLIFAGQGSNMADWSGLIMFSEYGYFRRSQFMIGANSGGWTFGDQNPLVQGYNDYELIAALDPEDRTIYAFWTHQPADEYSIKWDKENSEFNLHKYLVKGKEIVVKRNIAGDPASLSFEVSHGHLFDPNNLSSLWSICLKKFRKINLRFGEKIDGVDYWQQAGVFIIRDTKLHFERGTYPTMQVLAEDKMSLWELAEVTATQFYETTPKLILQDILQRYANLGPSEYNIPDFDDSITLYHQWVETKIKEILEQVCHRFRYFPRIDVNGVVTARKISDANPVDHTYYGKSWLLSFTPDDSFSDYTNRVTVIGEARDYIEVLYAEEPVATRTGTVGWWGHKKTLTVYYSEDGSRRCRYPRLEVIESVRSFNFRLGGGGESITYVDPEEKYCIITIEMPNLVFVLIAAIAALISLMVACSGCDKAFYCGICFVMQSGLFGTILNIIASVANYQYRIHARPVGKVRQSYQAAANDEELQTLIGTVVERRITDPLCYSVDHCRFVANFELLIAQLQRQRIKFTKIAHLQDEEGDTISIIHPYSEQRISVFITDITRRFMLPANPGSDEGYFLDDIEGWRL